MGRRKKSPEKVDVTPMRPAINSEARENQLIALAINVAEKQLLVGTASAQVITHYLKLGSTRERLEKEKIERENELLAAKREALESAKRIEELYSNALSAMRSYSGSVRPTDDEDSMLY